jgi:hypothetical protein
MYNRIRKTLGHVIFLLTADLRDSTNVNRYEYKLFGI